MVGRRGILKGGAAGSAGLLVPAGLWGGRAYADPQPGHGHRMGGAARDTVPVTPPLEKYVDALPRPKTAIPDPGVYEGAHYYDLTMRPGTWRFHRDLGPATVWGYWARDPLDPYTPIGMGYLGPTIEAVRDHPVIAKYRNELPTTHLFQFVIDKIHSGDVQLTPPPYMGEPELPADISVLNVVHQHGGFTPPQYDGHPAQWFTPDGRHGPGYGTLDPARTRPNETISGYTNHENSALLWYHDHGMAITALNVYAGLAGLWIIRDPRDAGLGLPGGEFEVPVILQDRTFHADGQLAYTMTEIDGADTAVVNGKAYPYLAVQPRRYRLRLLNGSNERFFRIRFRADDRDGSVLPFWVIGTDGGYRTPARLESLLTSPAERYDILVDFGALPLGTKVTLENFDAPVHFPDGVGPEIPELMQFQVTERLTGRDGSVPPERLCLPAVVPVRTTPATRRREFVVYQKVVNETITFNATEFMAPSQDFVTNGSTEIWEYVNPQHEGHPMHVHLINFQVLNRQPIDAVRYQADYEQWLANGRPPAGRLRLEEYVTGPPTPPDPDEVLAYKDTVKSYPATVTRIAMTFEVPGDIAGIPGTGTELPATYIHHCHILEHEDNDLMRPWTIVSDD